MRDRNRATGCDRDQMLLLPEIVDDYVAADNPVRFIEAFVEGLDLATLGFARVVPEAAVRGRRDRLRGLLDQLEQTGESQALYDFCKNLRACNRPSFPVQNIR